MSALQALAIAAERDIAEFAPARASGAVVAPAGWLGASRELTRLSGLPSASAEVRSLTSYQHGRTGTVVCLVFTDLSAFEAWWVGYHDGVQDRALPPTVVRRHEIEVATAMAGRA